LTSPAAKGAGLLTDSIIMTDNLATAMDKAIVSKLGQLQHETCRCGTPHNARLVKRRKN